MTFPALLHKPPSEPLCSPRRRLAHLGGLGTFSDDYVVIHCSNKASEPHIITISCTDRLGLACDIARTIFEFCLDVVQADFSIDGKWCLLLFWVTSRRQSIDWALLKERLVSECPSPSPSSFTQLGLKTCTTEKKIYLLQICTGGRLGILNDIVYTLWKLELEVLKVNALTSPNGSAVLVFLLRDIRSKVQGKRKETIGKQVKSVLGASISFLELSLASVDDVNEALDLEMLHGIPDELLSEDVMLPAAAAEGAPDAVNFSLSIDNSFSSAHTILQITCRDRRGLLYDCLRASSDLNLQIAYFRLSTTSTGNHGLSTTSTGNGVLDLFVSQANGAKLFDPDKQRSLLARLTLDVCEPVRVKIVEKGRNMELLVATTVEKCGRARPHTLYDVTLALKMLQIGIFKVDNEKVSHGERIWELYRFLLVEQASASLMMNSRMRSHVVERVESVLMG